MKLHIVTSNKNKYTELSLALESSFHCVQEAMEIVEIQGTSDEIIEDKLRQAYDRIQGPVLVDDVSAGIEYLGWEFPGPYVKPLLQHNSVQHLADLFEGSGVVGYCRLGLQVDSTTRIIVCGELRGKIVQPRGDRKFGFDPIFEVADTGRTLAEMTLEEKNTFSHRGRAIELLKEKIV
jgi:inosine triphosphate pyrophosphatase